MNTMRHHPLCPSCRRPVRQGALFCHRCGQHAVPARQRNRKQFNWLWLVIFVVGWKFLSHSTQVPSTATTDYGGTSVVSTPPAQYYYAPTHSRAEDIHQQEWDRQHNEYHISR